LQPKTIAEIKTELEKSPNSPLYVKDILKKKIQARYGGGYKNHPF